MLKKNLRVLFTFMLAAVLFASASAQDAGQFEPAASSNLTSARLPSGALRVAPASVPAEVIAGLDKIVEAGEGKLIAGDSEFLAWTGEGYTKANAANLMSQLETNLSGGGWKFTIGGREGDVTFFSALSETPKRRAVVGFYVAAEEGLLLAWREVLTVKSTE